jgi:hypothetical protein
MRSCAEELMEYCQDKGVGKAGETLFYGQGFNDEQNFEAVIFNDARGGYYERRLDGIAFEHGIVDVQARGPIPGDAFAKLNRVRGVLETMKGHVSDSKTHYESVLAISSPRMLMYDRGRNYIYAMAIKVMRRPSRVLDE